jgi:hypothetical protein
MLLKTKFDISDKIYHIFNQQKPYSEKCKFCDGYGYIFGINHEKSTCPKCYGRCGFTEYKEVGYRICGSLFLDGCDNLKENPDIPEVLTIGQIRVESTKNKSVWQCMCLETGIGSGSIYNLDDCFLTIEEAQTECDRRNVHTDNDEV